MTLVGLRLRTTDHGRLCGGTPFSDQGFAQHLVHASLADTAAVLAWSLLGVALTALGRA